MGLPVLQDVEMADGGDDDAEYEVAAALGDVVVLAGQQRLHLQSVAQCKMCDCNVVGARSKFVADGWDSVAG